MTSLMHSNMEVTQSILWVAGALLGLKIGSGAPSWLTIKQQNVHFLHISAPKAVLMGCSALYSEITAHMLLKSWNH